MTTFGRDEIHNLFTCSTSKTELEAFDLLTQVAAAECTAKCLHHLNELGVADAFEESISIGALARNVAANPEILRRVLRVVASYGIFCLRDEIVSHTNASHLLRRDHPHSQHTWIRYRALPIFSKLLDELGTALRTGESPGPRVLPGGWWSYVAERPEAGELFDEAMRARISVELPDIVGAYDFTRFERIADVGGGEGQVLRAVLGVAPNAQGLLFDLPHVLARVSRTPGDRIEHCPGSFFDSPIPAADAYILSDIIHDWDDEDAVAILRAVRRAAPAHARILLFERIVHENELPEWPKLLDIFMFALFGGIQRTPQQFERLLSGAGLVLENVIETASHVSILDACPADTTTSSSEPLWS